MLAINRNISPLTKNIKFRIETEKENKILFLDVLLIRNNNLKNAKVYPMYINWKLFPRNNWKYGTSKI